MSLLLDTMVISELRKMRTGRVHPMVRRWANTNDLSASYLSAITLMELRLGALLKGRRDPEGGRALLNWIDTTVLPGYEGRILPVTVAVALRCAELHVPKSVPFRDAWIAATALDHGLTVVTRNEKDFVPMGVRVVNPWTS